eukprot:m.26521 g.26521  ORF g.26521 m.26521 type:complete len:292 (-) comp8252_c0_seq1:25-900(-)
MSFDTYGGVGASSSRAPLSQQRGADYGTGSGRSQGFRPQQGQGAARMRQHAQQNVHLINKNVSQLQKMIPLLGTQRDTPDLRHGLQSLIANTGELCMSTSDDLKALCRQELPRGERLQQEKLMQDFQKILTEYKACSSKAMQRTKETLKHERQRAATLHHEHDMMPAEDREAAQLLDQQRMQQQEQLDEQIEYNEAVIVEREQGIRELESQMTEINSIFQDLGTLVHEQGHVLDNIEANMTTTQDNVQHGTEELVKASTYQKKARKKMFCVLIIVVIVAAILTIVLVTKLK